MANECIIRFFHEAFDCLQHSVVLFFDRNLLVVVNECRDVLAVWFRTSLPEPRL